ncbi:hypothetical protein EDD18DRAFT_1350826 [Armillaria luteobubalina]|uniref:Uncharacterized protein n=1 Tax=Armillaria luteobubalina TaxID=153913 RepID=A0AA39UYE5_9AGAR|nr:hypothetical protein EDD18DRAFT_1350826 [Armillaria luteobubalina]
MPIKPFALLTTTKPRSKNSSNMKTTKQKPTIKVSNARKKPLGSAPTKARHVVHKIILDVEEEEKEEAEEASEDDDDDEEGAQAWPYKKRKRALWATDISSKRRPSIVEHSKHSSSCNLLHGFKIKGILESLADEEEEDIEVGKDADKRPAETPEYVSIFAFTWSDGFFIFPDIEKHVCELEEYDTTSKDPLKQVFMLLSEINTGSQSGHGNDTSKINEKIIQLLIFVLNAGLQNLMKTLSEQMMLKLPTKVTPHYLPSFLYDESLVIDTDSHGGLFHGHTCIWAFHAIFLRNGHQDATGLHSTVKKKMELQQVSKHMIIYAAIQACFALSLCSKWGDDSDDFELEQFSEKLYKIFQDSRKDCNDWTEELIEFYILQILKPKNLDMDDNEEIDEDDDESILERNHNN